jgi:hypothetical protein
MVALLGQPYNDSLRLTMHDMGAGKMVGDETVNPGVTNFLVRNY